MSTKPSNSDIVEMVVSELTYIPTPEQRRVKSAFWARFSDNPIGEVGAGLTIATVARIVDDSRIPRWWSSPGFKQWFSNENEFRDRLEYLSHKILDTLEEILVDPRGNASARVGAAKLILEAARKMPSKQQEVKYIDAGISGMTKQQLTDYIKNNTKLLPIPAIADTKD